MIRFASGFWCLAMLVLISIYRGTLTSLLTSPRYKYIATNVLDIGRNEQLMPHVRQSSPSHDYIMVFDFTLDLLHTITIKLSEELAFRVTETDQRTFTEESSAVAQTPR